MKILEIFKEKLRYRNYSIRSIDLYVSYLKNFLIQENDNVDLLSKSHYGDLFYGYNNGDKENGRLFLGQWNQGKR